LLRVDKASPLSLLQPNDGATRADGSLEHRGDQAVAKGRCGTPQ
jgi:hypothetical protein